MKNLLLLIVLLTSTSIYHLQAQTEADEVGIKAFTVNFIAAYNNKDTESLQEFYMDDAVSIAIDGTQTKGAGNIKADYQKGFTLSNSTLSVQHKNISWSDAEHALIASGTYEVKGTIKANGNQFVNKGSYSNTMIKVDGEWKIAKSVLKSK